MKDKWGPGFMVTWLLVAIGMGFLLGGLKLCYGSEAKEVPTKEASRSSMTPGKKQ